MMAVDLEYLAKKIIELETKLCDPNEESYLVEIADFDRVSRILSQIGYVDGFSPDILFLQVYLPWHNSLSDIETFLVSSSIFNAKVGLLSPSRARCFDKNVARKAFVDFYSRILGATRKDFSDAKILAAQIEDENGVLFPHSNWFDF